MFETLPKINTERISGAVTGNIISSSKGNTRKYTLIEDVEDGIDEPPASYFSKAAARICDEIYNRKSCFLPYSKFLFD